MALPKRDGGRLVGGGALGLPGEPQEPLSSDKDGCLKGKEAGQKKERTKIKKRNYMRGTYSFFIFKILVIYIHEYILVCLILSTYILIIW